MGNEVVLRGQSVVERRSAAAPGPLPFVRLGTTWLAYGCLGYYSFLLNGLGPALPFLRTDLGLSFAQGSLHSSAFAAGMILAGLRGDLVTKRLGRARTLALGALGMAAGVLLLVAVPLFFFTLLGALIMGALGTLVLILVPAMLSDAHAESRATAMTEANVVASLCSSLAPLAIGGLAATSLGWRAGLLLGAVTVVPLVLWSRGAPDSTAVPAGRTRSTGRLPLTFWAYWTVIVSAVSIEFCLVFWVADFLHSVAGLPKSTSSALVGVFLVAMLFGRVGSSRLTRFLPIDRLFLLALAVAAVGFPVYWLVPSTGIRLVGLFVTGLGVAPLYPLSLALAVGTSSDRSDIASARASIASGTAILLAPLILGWLADHGGMSRAYGIVALMLGLTFLTSRVAHRLAVRTKVVGRNG